MKTSSPLPLPANYYFEGYASTFNVVDLHQDIISPGAFTRSIQRFYTNFVPLPCFWQHQHQNIIGYCHHLQADKKGLWVKGRLLSATKTQRFLRRTGSQWPSLNLSIGFVARHTSYDKRSHNRYIHDVDLKEISVVNHGANPHAHIQLLIPAPIRM